MLLLLVYFVVGVPDEEIVEREEDGDEGDANAVGDYGGHPYQLLVGLGLVQLLYEALGVLGQLDAVVHSVYHTVTCGLFSRFARLVQFQKCTPKWVSHVYFTNFVQ